MRILLVDRPIMLLDEPFGALDAITRSVMQQWLVSVWEERRGTLLFITHDTEEAILFSDRVLLMSSCPGRIVMDLRIDLPRPRTEEVANSVEALAYRRQVVDMLTGYPPGTANPPTAPPQNSRLRKVVHEAGRVTRWPRPNVGSRAGAEPGERRGPALLPRNYRPKAYCRYASEYVRRRSRWG